ncbi:phytoene/squalene synthase family protein [Planctomicrobium sp. SH664]|uniref:phytoene/squalene synthase family protein n=1 Tax=Planctomicrobium sp. SH664 TaxID=3448125 RepID=UPI003F5B47BE
MTTVQIPACSDADRPEMAELLLQDCYRQCEQLARRSGSNFFHAFRILPRDMFREMCALYAYMRHTDDLGDQVELEISSRVALLQSWERQLDACLRGERTGNAILTALADVARKRNLVPEELREVIAGVRGDLQPRRFETFEDLERYCYQVAGVVGLSSIRIWGFRGELPREPALACGTAFQLTNILRDVGEDARMGRIYLPQEDLQRFGYSTEDLSAGRRNGCFRDLMTFQWERARSYYIRSLELLDQLSPAGRRILSAFLELYGSLLENIRQADYDVFSRKIRVSRWKKLRIAARALWF